MTRISVPTIGPGRTKKPGPKGRGSSGEFRPKTVKKTITVTGMDGQPVEYSGPVKTYPHIRPPEGSELKLWSAMGTHRRSGGRE